MGIKALAPIRSIKRTASKRTTRAIKPTERHVTLPAIPKLPRDASDNQRLTEAQKVYDAARKYHLDTPEKIAALPPDARRKLNRVKLAFCPERVHDAIGNHGYGARSLVESEVVTVRGRISVLPLRGSGARIE